MSELTAPRIAFAPDAGGLEEAVLAGGGEIHDLDTADALVWTAGGDPAGLAQVLQDRPGLRWVQLPFAGIENFVPLVRDGRLWTCGKGAYADPVAEFALSLALAGMRSVAAYARSSSWSSPTGRSLLGARVTLVGGGGIAASLIRMLTPFGADITVVRHRPEPVPGAARTLASDRLHEAIADRDLVVLALPLTPATRGLIGTAELELMGEDAWLVNVGRGALVVTDDLVDALRRERIAGAALDVTDPEPLPDGHPLWSLPNCLVAPHSGNIAAISARVLAERIRENVRRKAVGLELLGVIDGAAGY